MLVISSYLDRSEIEGIGLFAGQDIKEGDIVWYLDPSIDQIFTKDDFKDLCFSQAEDQSERFKKWSYKRENDYVLCADNTKFSNHSDTPNLGGDNKQYDVALRDIKRGEELTYDYRVFDKETDLKLAKGNSYDKGREKVGETTKTIQNSI
jgi:uncharacterized protein